MRRTALVLAAVVATASTTAHAQKLDPNDLPAAAVVAIGAAAPELRITGAELKAREGRRYLDVEGRLPDGAELELDLLENDAGWTVVEIQRDVVWLATPEAVRKAAAARWKGPEPVRVIESRQTDGAVIYELFAAGRPAKPSLEVQSKAGIVTLLDDEWPH